MSQLPIHSSDLPGERSREFVGDDHGAGVSVILVDAAPGAGPRLHRHAYEEVFILQAGKATFTLDQDQVQAGPGDIVVAPAHTPHGFVNSGDERLRLTAIHNSPRFVTEWLE